MVQQNGTTSIFILYRWDARDRESKVQGSSFNMVEKNYGEMQFIKNY